MAKSIAITQPNFVPWIGCFEMIDRVDTFVFLDDVQYPRKEWVNRNRIRSPKAKGWDWITVPVSRGGDLAQLICETKIAENPRWAEPMMETLARSYDGSPYFIELAPGLSSLLSSNYPSIADLNIAVISWGCELMGIETTLLRASELPEPGIKDEKLIRIIRRLDGDFYLANNGSAAYIRPELFREAGIGFEFQNFSHPPYAGFDPTNTPPLSFLDILFREGPFESLKVLRSGRPVKSFAL